MHCLILAGGEVRPDDPLYSYSQGKPKAFIDMGGRTMLERVVAALQSSPSVEDIVVVGVDPAAPELAQLTFARPVAVLPDQGGMVPNMLAGVHWIAERYPEAEIIMGCSADIPAITGPVVDAFVEACRPWDRAIYYNFVSREVLERRFPNSNRTYSRINGLEVAGGDMVIARVDIVDRLQAVIESVTSARKQPWKIARLVGLPFLLKFLLRRVTFRDIEETAGRIIEAPVQIVLNEHAELAMDADKPYQVDLLRAEFAS